MNGDDNPQMGFQGDDDEGDMPPEMKDHMLAAFAHKAGLGPHPGKYKGPPRKKRDSDEITDTDMQRAEEEPIGEASAAKMHAAQTGGGDIGLGPSAMDQAQVKQSNAMNQQADTQAAVQAAKAQAAQAPVNAPSAPSGPQGVTIPFPAQAGPQPQPPQPSPAPPPAPGPNQGAPVLPDEEDEEEPPPPNG